MEETVYFVFNSARHPTTRLLRTIAPGRASHVQWILGGTRRLVGNGFAKINRGQLEAYWDDLKWRCRTGQLVIRVGGPRGPVFSFNDPEIEKVEEQTSESVNEEAAVESTTLIGEPLSEIPVVEQPVEEAPEVLAVSVEEGNGVITIPDMKSSRSEIVEYALAHGVSEAQLEGLTKRQILALVEP